MWETAMTQKVYFMRNNCIRFDLFKKTNHCVR